MSKKEEQRKKKEEKQAAAKRKQQLNAMLFKVAVVILVPLTLFVFYQGLFTGPPSLPPNQVGDSDHVMGAADAPVTITVYADFQCPNCFTESQVIARAWPRIQDKARVVYRYFPLDTHRWSFQSARYAEAASRQGKFWEMHDLIFNSQDTWAAAEDPTPIFDGFARQLQLDLDQLHADLDLPEVRAKILADQQGGISAGVRATPTMFINGDLVPSPQTAGRLVDMVNEAAAGQ